MLAVVDAQARRDDSGRPSPTPVTRSAAASGSSSCSTHPERVSAAVLLLHRREDRRRRPCGRDRIGQVRASGTAVLVGGAVERWFAPGFADREPDTRVGLLHALQDADDVGYVRVCEALAGVRRARPAR